MYLWPFMAPFALKLLDEVLFFSSITRLYNHLGLIFMFYAGSFVNNFLDPWCREEKDLIYFFLYLRICMILFS